MDVKEAIANIDRYTVKTFTLTFRKAKYESYEKTYGNGMDMVKAFINGNTPPDKKLLV